MSNFPFKHPVTRRTLTRHDLEERLRSFEDAWAEQTGNRITSAEFYDRYRAGEIDSLLATAWSSYYEVFRRLGSGAGGDDVVRALAAAG